MSYTRFLKQQAYIGGHWCDADDRGTVAVTNPATGEVLGTVPNMGRMETRRAIEAAEAARHDWAARTAAERSAILRRFFNLILQNQDDLGELLTREQGKPLAEAKGEVMAAPTSSIGSLRRRAALAAR